MVFKLLPPFAGAIRMFENDVKEYSIQTLQRGEKCCYWFENDVNKKEAK